MNDRSGVTLLVTVKHVPVGGASLRIDGEQLTRQGLSHGLDPINEVALEWALQARESGAADRVIVACMGPQEAIETLRKALAIGADEAVLVTDRGLAGADVRTTAAVLAAVARRVDADLLLTGYESADGSSGVVPAATAALLGWPLISRFGQGELSGRLLRGERDLGAGAETLEVDLPAVVSVVEGHIAPRYPKLREVLRTKAAHASTYTAADLGVQPASGTEVVSALVSVPQPAKQATVLDLDAGVDELFALFTGGVRA